MLDGLPIPERDEESSSFWAACDEGLLCLPECRSCGMRRWPPGPVCPRCGHSATNWIRSAGTGSVYSWVVVHVALDPALATQIPYVVGLIDLDEGVRIVSTIEDVEVDAIRAGMPVVVRFGDRDASVRLPGFVPIAARTDQ